MKLRSDDSREGEEGCLIECPTLGDGGLLKVRNVCPSLDCPLLKNACRFYTKLLFSLPSHRKNK